MKNTGIKRNIAFIKSFLSFLIILLGVEGALGQKTDQITLMNGNQITGEVKKMEYGKLTYSTDDFGTVSVNWEKVIFITSDKVFEIETKDGYLYIGRLEQMADTGLVLIRAGSAGSDIRLIDITSIYPIRSRFFQRISGPVNIGAGYTKANELFQITYDGDLVYWGKRIYSGLSFSGGFSRQYDSIFTQRQQYTYVFGKNMRKHWYTGGLVGFEQNSELGIQSRLNLGYQLGRTMIENNSNNLTTSIGLQGTREIYYSDKSSTTNLELLIEIKYKRFLYYSPKSDITTDLQILPGLTSWGRLRANYSITLSQEIFKDFFWSLSFYISYDNKPHEDDTPTSDWGITTGLGYSF